MITAAREPGRCEAHPYNPIGSSGYCAQCEGEARRRRPKARPKLDGVPVTRITREMVEARNRERERRYHWSRDKIIGPARGAA